MANTVPTDRLPIWYPTFAAFAAAAHCRMAAIEAVQREQKRNVDIVLAEVQRSGITGTGKAPVPLRPRSHLSLLPGGSEGRPSERAYRTSYAVLVPDAG